MHWKEITEPLFITEEIEVEMLAAGYVFEVPKLITVGHRCEGISAPIAFTDNVVTLHPKPKD